MASQLSAVHVLPSLQSAAVLQHPGMARCTQVRFARLHASFVQALASLQSATDVQHPGIGALTHTPGVPPEVSHVSVVHTFASEQSAAVVQLVAACRTEPVSKFGSPDEPHRRVPKASKAPMTSEAFFDMCSPEGKRAAPPTTGRGRNFSSSQTRAPVRSFFFRSPPYGTALPGL